MSVSLEPKVKVHEMAPVFQAIAVDGTAADIWDFKEQKSFVLAFLPGENCENCLDFLRSVAENYPHYVEETSVFIAIVRGTLDQAEAVCSELCAPFQIVDDTDGHITNSYTNALPAVFVADRYGELRAEWIIGPDGAFPSQKDIMDVVELSNLECPECGDMVYKDVA